MSDPAARTPASLLVPYAAPYVLYVAIGALADPRSHALWIYGARLVAVGAALAFYWRRWLPLRGPRPVAGSIAWGALFGLAGAGLWLGLHAPFAPSDAPAWSEGAWAARALGATLLPPLIEEPLFRGWALGVGVLYAQARAAGDPAPLGRALDRSDLASVAPGAWTPLALVGSTALFAAGHHAGEWLAACGYGALMCALWIARGDLVSCISAHAVTNAALAVFARATGAWGSW
ncbi:MAG TPA: CPBP family glutamic-type intramembrane protease [Myxococcota bacterium]|nr:CPBP family glutamic-type intramembrane protease [Myxococcota bacterium]